MPIDFNKIVEQAINNLKEVIQSSDTVITMDKLPIALVDESQMVELFQNLIGNAIMFSGENNLKIHISAEQKNGNWEFSVRDNGASIAPTYYERVFINLQRLNTRADYLGSGLGLAVSKKIIERHGGKIWLKNQSDNESIIYFTIPIREENE